ncbi:MAG: glycosyltransferase family 2 protein [Lachnospiraceae bacterium]|jgi:glycosyltransferase involved in cell wall biosynthesis|nr:glycosyltransferase family 2 protein [Lachnospiraceae bacterium]
MNNINLSIIIPHYNSPDYLERLLRSIPQRDDLQVIVVDDRSTERLTEYESCQQRFSQAGVIFLRNEGIKGAGASRNIGLLHAVGKWLIFADADDYFLEGFYEMVSHYFNDKADMVYFPPTSCEETTGREGNRHWETAGRIEAYRLNKTHDNELKMRYKIVGPWSRIIRREMVNRNSIKFDEVMHSNDVMFSVKVAFYSKHVSASAAIIYCISCNGTSLTTNTSKAVYKQRINVWLEYYLFLRNHLSHKEFMILDLHGAGRIMTGIKNKVGIKLVWKTIAEMRKNRVALVPHGFLKPVNWQERIYFHLRKKRLGAGQR